MRKTKQMVLLLGTICFSMTIGAVSISAMTDLRTGQSGRLCDTNGDGIVDLQDAQNVLKHALHIIKDFPDEYADADADRDGEVTLNDANLVLKYALNIINELDGDKPAFTAVPTKEPAGTSDPVYMEPSPELLDENADRISEIIGNLLAQWATGQYTQEEAETKANIIVRDICGVVYHVKWFPYNQKSEAFTFWDGRIKIAEEARFSTFTMQMISREDKGCFLIYF